MYFYYLFRHKLLHFTNYIYIYSQSKVCTNYQISLFVCLFLSFYSFKSSIKKIKILIFLIIIRHSILGYN